MTRQLPLALPHGTALGAEDFFVTPSNRDAAQWVERWPDWPAPGLVIAGESGSGKTHLLSLWRGKSGAAALDKAALAAEGKYFALDDADALAGDAGAEEALFHLFNRVKNANGALLLAMKRAPAHAGFRLPDLRSRLLTLPVAALAAPDDELLGALIVKQFRDRQIAPDAGVIAYLMPRIARDAAAIRRLVEKLDRAALAEGRKISVALARRVLETPDA